MASLLFVALAPLATVLMLVVGLVAWRRRQAPGGRWLVAFSAAEAAWLACDALSVVAPTPEATVRLAQATFVWSPLLGVAWIGFVLSYTERATRRSQVAVGALAAWCLAFGGMALTNDAHRLVWASWETVPDGAFLSVAYALGPLAWVQTAFMWAAMTLSLGVLLWTYGRDGGRAPHLSRWIVAGALVPLFLNVVFLLGLSDVQRDFTPIAMAVSSGAFALGLVRYRFLDLRPIARAALVDNLRDGMLVLDTRGRVVDVNPALREALGDTLVRVGRPLAETAPALADAIGGAPGAAFPVGSGDDARYLDLRVSPLADLSGAPAGHLVLLHDVTHRRAERAALRRANDDLRQANEELQARNEELDAFAHTVAHDLKNSAQGVTGWAEILRDEGPELPRDAHRELADGVVRSAHKMGTVIQELLLLAGVRRVAVEPLPIAMGHVVGEALARVQHSGPSPTELKVPARWPVALGHAPWVEEVWVNYLSNAAKYGGPTVTLGAEPTADGHVRFWVHDNGSALDPEAQGRLFVPFTRLASEPVEGTGLGLSIVRRIADRLGGACGVASAPGEGTTFWFTLPAAAGTGEPPRAARPFQDAPASPPSSVTA